MEDDIYYQYQQRWGESINFVSINFDDDEFMEQLYIKMEKALKTNTPLTDADLWDEPPVDADL